jgi:hypothetical protein
VNRLCSTIIAERQNIAEREKFDDEYRSGVIANIPASFVHCPHRCPA